MYQDPLDHALDLQVFGQRMSERYLSALRRAYLFCEHCPERFTVRSRVSSEGCECGAFGALIPEWQYQANLIFKLIAWLVYTDGHVINVEQAVSREYMSVLDIFSTMSAVESRSNDHEVRNRHVY